MINRFDERKKIVECLGYSVQTIEDRSNVDEQ